MSSLYKNNDTWYLSITHNGKRISRSTKTNDHKVALALKPHIEKIIIDELIGFSRPIKELAFPEISERFLNYNHGWSESTIKLNSYIINSHINGKALPINPTSNSIHTRVINQCWNFGLKHNLISKAYKLPGDIKGESRMRTFSKDELNLIFDSLKPISFNKFVQFAYYTGARSGEIRSISNENLFKDRLVTRGKSGRRIVKLNTQAQKVIESQNVLWNYSKDYVSHKFKKEVRRLGINNARFHDLRRTFGLNLIKQGMSIYKVSKLLGHKSVKTTEQHYAPLMTIDIEDFIL